MRKEESAIARDWKERKREEVELPKADELMKMIRESQRMAAETVRMQAVAFLEYCLLSPPDVAMAMIAEVVSGKRKEF